MAKSQNTYSFIKFEYGTLKNLYENIKRDTGVSIGYQTLGTWMRGVKPHESNMDDYNAIMDYLTLTKGVRFPSRRLNTVIVPEREIPFGEHKIDLTLANEILGMMKASYEKMEHMVATFKNNI